MNKCIRVIGLLMVLLIAASLLTGCFKSEGIKTERFIFAEHQKTSVAGNTMYDMVIVDTQTGVSYLLSITANGTALTPLIDADGNPVVYNMDLLSEYKGDTHD